MVYIVLWGLADLLLLILAAIFAVLLTTLLGPRRLCPDCGATMPRFKGSKWWQVLIERKTCLVCGCVVNYEGQKLRNGQKPRPG
jgi:hypothetical protein